MASLKQIIANKKNATHSTGPRSVAGRARSSCNALKTGAYAKLMLLVDDDPKEFGRLRLEFYREWRPVGVTERLCVERLVAITWRSRRYYRAEAGLFAMHRDCPGGQGGVATAINKDGVETQAFSRLLQMDAAADRSFDLVVRRLQRLQAKRAKRSGLSGHSAETAELTSGSEVATGAEENQFDYPQI